MCYYIIQLTASAGHTIYYYNHKQSVDELNVTTDTSSIFHNIEQRQNGEWMQVPTCTPSSIELS